LGRARAPVTGRHPVERDQREGQLGGRLEGDPQVTLGAHGLGAGQLLEPLDA
jgi:hypothetical protein